MKKYQVYIVINVTCQEVYFGAMSESLEELFATVHPPELAHWELSEQHISVPVLISGDLSMEEAIVELSDLETKALANPQGKKILHNCLLDS